MQPSGAGPSDNVEEAVLPDNYQAYESARSIASEIADRFAPDSVLDVGCGRGYLVQALKSQGLDARGIDKSEQAIGDAPDSDCSVGDIGSEKLSMVLDGADLVCFLDQMQELAGKNLDLAIANLCSLANRFIIFDVPNRRDTPDSRSLQWCLAKFRVFGFQFLEMAPWAAENAVALGRTPLSARPRRRTCDVSAIIPVFNGRRFLLQAVNSVLNQTLPVRELILVDDGSSEPQFDCLDGLDATVNIITHVQPNSGQSVARNAGAKLASGDFLAFLDQDDLWYPNHVEILRSYFAQEGGDRLGWVYSNLDRVDLSGEMNTRSFLDTIPAAHPKKSLAELLREDLMILPSASLIRRTSFDAVNGFDERLLGYEDDDLFLRLFRDGWDNAYVDKALSRWRIHSGSCSYSPRMAQSRRTYMYKLIDEYPDQPGFGTFWIRDFIAPRFIANWLGEYENAIQSGDFGACREIALDLERLAKLSGRNTLLRKVALLAHPELFTRLRAKWSMMPGPVRHMGSRLLGI